MKPTPAVQRLRRLAIAQTFFPPTTLEGAFERLGFVQADPIRAPARAHDLILRHRVKGYRAGDLERRYHALGIEEDELYAYGFVRRDLWAMLHPAAARDLSPEETMLLAKVRELGRTHPNDLVPHFGNERSTNAWGSQSRSTTMALERLQQRGLLRIAHRVKGVRVYEAVPASEAAPDAEASLRALTMAELRLLSPSPVPPQSPALRLIRRALGVKSRDSMADDLVAAGKLQTEIIDKIRYVWPAGSDEASIGNTVRFLAPFDPLVWDRKRFEHLWGWPYRFEAYTPTPKRTMGYYALPLLWRDDVIGWANLKVTGGSLDVDVGYVQGKPASKLYDRALASEIARFEAFMGAGASRGV